MPVQAEELKVGYVNVAKVFDSYEGTKASESGLEKKGKQKETELEARMNELNKLRQNLELLNEEAREAKAREYETKADELKRFRTNTARDLREERNEIAAGILKEIEQAVAQYAQANGFAFILDERSLLFGESARDVTDEVLVLLDKRYAQTH